MSAEPGEDACLKCRHPDHGKAECGALMGTFHGDDGTAGDDLCDCTGYAAGDLGALSTDDLPAMHPDEIARAAKRTQDYIRARYGAGPIPPFYDQGGVLFAGPTWVRNDSGEDEEVIPWPY